MGWSAAPPAGPTNTAQQTIGSGNSITLVPAASNPIGLQVWSAVISSAANGTSGLGSSFTVDDTITDSNGTVYLTCEIGVPAGGGTAHNTTPPSMQGIIIPAGLSVILNNGGSGGMNALHRAAAILIYTRLSP